MGGQRMRTIVDAATGALIVARVLTVGAESAGLTLRDFLAKALPHMPDRPRALATANRILRQGDALVPPPGVVLTPETRVWEGLTMELHKAYPGDYGIPDALSILYADETMLVVDKPAGLPIHPTPTYFIATVVNALVLHHRLPNGFVPGTAHRLDRETSGVLVCGLSNEHNQTLGRIFEGHSVHKEYLALCEGHPPTNSFDVRLPLRYGASHIKLKVVPDETLRDPNAKPAHTACAVERRFVDPRGRPLTLLRCTLHTGRQHQIRAHLCAIGLPLVGDKLYGPNDNIFSRLSQDHHRVAPPGSFDPALSSTERAQLRLWRHALHAAKVVLPHPISDSPVTIEAPLPRDITDLLTSLTPVD